jgi:hypothetical protein
MEKIIHKLINEFTEGVDTYTHNDSTWLIFTETKQWVIELTENKTLWYNYNFFKSVFAYASLDCVQNQHLITKWVEDNIINKELTYVTLFRDARDRKQQFEDTLENGVNKTKMAHMKTCWSVDDTIENGVKETNSTLRRTLLGVDDIIQNGVKNTDYWGDKRTLSVEGTLENGVKKTDPLHFHRPFLVKDTDNGSSDKKLGDINDIIQNGVKEIYEYKGFRGDVKDVIQNGVRDTQYSEYENQSWINGVIKEGVKETKSGDKFQFLCEEVIDKGVKETKYHMSKLRVDAYKVIDIGVKETSHVDVMKFFDNKMEDALKNGVKETKQKKNALLILDTSGRELILESHLVVRDGVRSSTPRQYVGENIIDKIINKGITDTIECDWDVPTDLIKDVISEGVKETYEDVYHHKGRINGVIKNGVKETMAGNYTDPSTSLLYIRWETQIEDVIDNGNKVCGTYVGGHRQEEKTETVIEYGKQI